MSSGDGIWEFLDSEFVVKAVAKILSTDGPTRTAEKLQREARKRWRQEEGVCDARLPCLILFDRLFAVAPGHHCHSDSVDMRRPPFGWQRSKEIEGCHRGREDVLPGDEEKA